MKKIRVLVVEDSMVFRELLVKNLNMDPELEVVAVARDPFEARDAIIAHKPDVMTLDVEMPRMSGIEFLRKLMPQYPIPVVMISSLSGKVFDAMNAGAVDFVSKPTNANRIQIEEFIKNEIPAKIKIAAVAKIFRRKTEVVTTSAPGEGKRYSDNLVVAIGASTGGPEAIAEVLQGFRDDIPGIIITQHMPVGFTKLYANRLNEQCKIRVKEAQTGDVVKQGQALIAPGGDAHMHLVRMNNEYQVVLRKAPKVNGHCPSVDVMFQSVAKVAGKNALGIILTGMGGDGARGLLAMRQAGACTIGQDPTTCVVYGMPQVAYDIGAVQFQEKLPNIAPKTYILLNKM